MAQKRNVKLFFSALNIIIIILLIWSLINYKVLNEEVGELVQVGGLIVLVLIIIIFEGAPVFVGPGMGVGAVLAMGVFDPKLILLIFLISAVVGNIIYFSLGYIFGKKVLDYFDEKDVKRYKELFKKYGKAAMIVMAVSPMPYLPSLAGVFRVKSPIMITEVLLLRLIRHVVVFSMYYYAILLI